MAARWSANCSPVVHHGGVPALIALLDTQGICPIRQCPVIERERYLMVGYACPSACDVIDGSSTASIR
ncbi:MAG: hypothetical protein JNN32_06585 [Flavobacteriales bacterium]|nr:hypothetical protein [Flavobacteriales bacterium]